MIVKIKDGESNWIMFGEVEEIYIMNDSIGEKDMSRVTVFGVHPTIARTGTLFRIMQSHGMERFILSYDVTYLLNNEGKTIERIN